MGNKDKAKKGGQIMGKGEELLQAAAWGPSGPPSCADLGLVPFPVPSSTHHYAQKRIRLMMCSVSSPKSAERQWMFFSPISAMRVQGIPVPRAVSAWAGAGLGVVTDAQGGPRACSVSGQAEIPVYTAGLGVQLGWG